MKKYLASTLSVAWSIFKYALLIIAAILILVIILLSGAYKDLRGAAAKGLAGKAELTQAVQAAQAEEWRVSLNLANQAQADFSDALKNLQETHDNPAVKNLTLIRNQVNDLEYLLRTAEILSRSLTRILPIADNLSKISSENGKLNFSDLADNDKIRFLQLIYQSEPELTGLKADLELALLNLEKIHRIGILWPVYQQISDIRQELNQATILMSRVSPLIKLLPALAGYPNNSHFLLILQNNDELRPTGGFIGVYGILESHNGNIVSLKSDDSYHLDMPASLSNSWTLQAPAIIKKYLKVEKWYLRDANWSPDWPTSAKKINEIFQGENLAIKQPSESFTGIAAITPDLVADLIRLVGPISVKGADYNADNFQPLLQYNVEVAYKDQNISSWDRKEIINELMAELENRLLKLPPKNWPELLKIIDKAIDSKSLQLYFANDSWEDLARNLGASGEVKKWSGDYLLAVDSNLGAFKSDVVVKKNLSYTVTEDRGGLSATVKLNYRHEGNFDWRTTRYRSYTRVYAPLGSYLVSLSGVDEKTADMSVENDTALNKTVFGFFFTVEPGTSREIIISYRLPSNIDQELKSSGYSLLVQKQAGQRIESLNISVKPLKGKNYRWSTDLESDKAFQFNDK